MTPKAITYCVLGVFAIVLAFSASACTSPSSASDTLTACHVTASDLTVPGGGKSAAPTLPAGDLNIDGSTALAPLFQRAAGNVTANSANGKVSASIVWTQEGGTSGTMTANISDGQSYQGSFFEVTSETNVDELGPIWTGWEGRRNWAG